MRVALRNSGVSTTVISTGQRVLCMVVQWITVVKSSVIDSWHRTSSLGEMPLPGNVHFCANAADMQVSVATPTTLLSWHQQRRQIHTISMAIPFQPKARSIVYCDFRGFEAPEMIKRRPVIVLASHKRNSRLVAVVPLSTTPPSIVEAHQFQLRHNPIADQTAVVWAKSDMVAVVSTARLDLIRLRRRRFGGHHEYLNAKLGHEQFSEIQRGVASALGLASP